MSKGIIDSKFKILEQIGRGATSTVYLVKEEDKPEVYAAKVIKKEYMTLENEIKIWKIVSGEQHITNLISSGEGPIVKESESSENLKYVIMEYAEKSNLLDYILLAEKGLSERHAKYIFSLILKGIQGCHNKGVCHRDIKMENILLGKDFNIKISDFGFSTLIKGDDGSDLLKDFVGTKSYMAPEIWKKKEYKGVQADIFSLGALLFSLVACKFGFNEATKDDTLYRNIMLNHFDKYWNIIEPELDLQLSNEFKNLFTKMISFQPKKRPSIESILNEDEWMKEIKELNEAQLNDLAKEVYEELAEREKVIKTKKEGTLKIEAGGEEEGGFRECDDKKEYFRNDLVLKYEKTGVGMKNFIKIEGEINPYDFMNDLANKLYRENEQNCSITESDKSYRFNIKFIKTKETNIPEDELEELKKLGLDDDIEFEPPVSEVKVKLAKTDNGHVLTFEKKAGDMVDFYDNVKIIKKAVYEMF